MDLKKKAIEGAVVAVIVILALVAYAFVTHKAVGPIDVNAGAAGNLLIENYIPVIGQNGGLKSALPVWTTSTFEADGASTLAAATLSGLITESAGVLYTNASATTTKGSETVKQSDLQGYDTIILTPIVASATITFPASSTLSTWLPSAGNSQDTCFINGTTTSAIVLTFAGGTGTLLQVASSSATALGAVTLYPQKEGCFHFTRANATATTFDIIGAYTAFQ